MGIKGDNANGTDRPFVQLIVDRDGIALDLWAEIYETIVAVLKAFPVPLVRETTTVKCGYSLPVYSENIEVNCGTSGEYLQVDGDAITQLTGASFRVFKSGQFSGEEAKLIQHGGLVRHGQVMIRVISIPEKSLFTTRWLAMECSPVTLAALALGIVLETKAPETTYFSGRFTEENVLWMMEWLRLKFGLALIEPLCIDKERLLARVESVFQDDPFSLIRAFLAQCVLPIPEQIKFLGASRQRDALKRFLIKMLSSEKFCSTTEGQHIVAQSLWMDNSLVTAIDVVKSSARAKRSNSRETHSELARLYHCIYRDCTPLPPHTSVQPRSDGGLRLGENRFAFFSQDYRFLWDCSVTDLDAVFLQHGFSQDSLKKIRKGVEEERRCAPTTLFGSSPSTLGKWLNILLPQRIDVTYSLEDLRRKGASLGDMEKILIRRAVSFRSEYKVHSSGISLKAEFTNFLKNMPFETFFPVDVQADMVSRLCAQAATKNVRLLESTWELIERETRLECLYMLMVLILSGDLDDFENLRRSIILHPEEWQNISPLVG